MHYICIMYVKSYKNTDHFLPRLSRQINFGMTFKIQNKNKKDKHFILNSNDNFNGILRHSTGFKGIVKTKSDSENQKSLEKNSCSGAHKDNK